MFLVALSLLKAAVSQSGGTTAPKKNNRQFTGGTMDQRIHVSTTPGELRHGSE